MDRDEKKQINAKVDQVVRRILVNLLMLGAGAFLLWQAIK